MLGTHDWLTMILWLGVATLLVFGLGMEREWRGHGAGMWTRALVALSAAMTTMPALLLFDDLQSRGGRGDPLRVVQGLAQAIGIIAGGLIYSRGGEVRNMTTAACLWIAAAVGIAAGAGQFGLVAIAASVAAALLLLEGSTSRIFNHEQRERTSPPISSYSIAGAVPGRRQGRWRRRGKPRPVPSRKPHAASWGRIAG